MQQVHEYVTSKRRFTKLPLKIVIFKTHNRAEKTSEQINISTTRKHLFTSWKTELGKDTDMPFL